MERKRVTYSNSCLFNKTKIYLHNILFYLENKNYIQVYEFFQCNQVRSKIKNIPLSTYTKNIIVITSV